MQGLDPLEYPKLETSYEKRGFDEIFGDFVSYHPTPVVSAYIEIYGKRPKGCPIKKEDYEVYR
ncbi:hypothetical protein DBR11_26240 [Pedobacter sp. HMWF019]|nr:hypothetical protein DBR11_26240 [Pedobacter sp. HMWF019]